MITSLTHHFWHLIKMCLKWDSKMNFWTKKNPGNLWKNIVGKVKKFQVGLPWRFFEKKTEKPSFKMIYINSEAPEKITHIPKNRRWPCNTSSSKLRPCDCDCVHVVVHMQQKRGREALLSSVITGYKVSPRIF